MRKYKVYLKDHTVKEIFAEDVQTKETIEFINDLPDGSRVDAPDDWVQSVAGFTYDEVSYYTSEEVEE